MLQTPFHPRTEALCESHQWRDWVGYRVASCYEPTHEREYFAIRNSAALIDVSPLFKYDVEGRDAERLLDRVMTRDVRRCKVGRVAYGPWCDERGKVIQDGNLMRLGRDRFRLSAAEPTLRWLVDCAEGMKVTVTDRSTEIAALALQGPRSLAILREVVNGADLDRLPFFGAAEALFGGDPVVVTRTGFTGDLGYELWVRADDAVLLWDRLFDVGAAHGLQAAGMLALDQARIEAGLPLIEVDFLSAPHALLPARESSPFELGLGWAVDFAAGNDFVGRAALEREREQGSKWSFVGLEVDWFELERLWSAWGLRPQTVVRPPSRLPVPVRGDGRQVGQATSQTFSPLLKKHLALASVESEYATPGRVLELEMTVEFERLWAQARVVELPFFDPPRKRARGGREAK